MRSGTVRPIEYEIVPRSQAASIGLGSDTVARYLSFVDEVAVLRCVDDDGEKLTAVGYADHLRTLLRSGEASDPAGMKLLKSGFPVVVSGWRQAS